MIRDKAEVTDATGVRVRVRVMPNRVPHVAGVALTSRHIGVGAPIVEIDIIIVRSDPQPDQGQGQGSL